MGGLIKTIMFLILPMGPPSQWNTLKSKNSQHLIIRSTIPAFKTTLKRSTSSVLTETLSKRTMKTGWRFTLRIKSWWWILRTFLLSRLIPLLRTIAFLEIITYKIKLSLTKKTLLPSVWIRMGWRTKIIYLKAQGIKWVSFRTWRISLWDSGKPWMNSKWPIGPTRRICSHPGKYSE